MLLTVSTLIFFHFNYLFSLKMYLMINLSLVQSLPVAICLVFIFVSRSFCFSEKPLLFFDPVFYFFSFHIFSVSRRDGEYRLQGHYLITLLFRYKEIFLTSLNDR